MIAVIKTGGKQYTVQEGDVLRIEKLEGAEEGKEVTFDEVLLVSNEDGSNTKVGTPVVSGASVTGSVMKNGRAKKLLVKKFKAKIRYSRTYGHRQPYTEIKIAKINA